MKTNSLTTALALSDQDLLSRIPALAGSEREATAELVAHLAALELRPSLYAAEGYGSLFAYCTEALRLSEDAACNRIEAARACRSFPVILDLLASGSLTLTAVRKLGKHLTPENHETVLARGKHQKKEQIEALVAELAPKPDVVSSVRKLPAPRPTSALEVSTSTTVPPLKMAFTDPAPAPGPTSDENRAAPPPVFHAATPPPPPRALLQVLAPGRYRVRFTIGQDGYDNLRRLQTLLRRDVPNGDPGVIFERFIGVLLEKVERDKLGTRGKASNTGKGRRSMGARGDDLDRHRRATSRAYENRIRSRTDGTSVAHMTAGVHWQRRDRATSRTRSSGRSGSGTGDSVRLWPTLDTAVRNAASSSSITSNRTPWMDGPRSGTSHSGAPATTSTSPNGSSEPHRAVQHDQGVRRLGTGPVPTAHGPVRVAHDPVRAAHDPVPTAHGPPLAGRAQLSKSDAEARRVR